jgi:hypothetical protein
MARTLKAKTNHVYLKIHFLPRGKHSPPRLPRQHVSVCEISGGRSGTGTGFSPSGYALPFQYHSTNAPYSFSSTCYIYQEKETKLGDLSKSNALKEIREHWRDECFHRKVMLHREKCIPLSDS